MPKVGQPIRQKPDKCKACNGTGKSSTGWTCWPCKGTGRAQKQ